MIYTPQTKKAIKLIYKLHKDQVDKSGLPYVFHPFHVAEKMDDEKTTVLALLHDVLEDTNVTKNDLKQLGFDDGIVETLDLLTHKIGDDYSEYIKRISSNIDAIKVKLVDLEHNMCLDRLDNLTNEDLIRVKKYQESYNFLKDCLDLKNKSEQKTYENSVIKNSIMGFVVGDALGVPVEFKNRDFLRENPLNEMIGFGTHNVPKGTWSDDTSMILATMDSIVECGDIDYNDLMLKFYEWFKYAKYTATNEVFDIGIATKKAILNYESGMSALNCGLKGFYDNGNGSLMRILPIIFYSIANELDFNDEKKIVDRISSLTHAHEVSKLGCKIFVDYAKNLIRGLDKFAALKELPIPAYIDNYSYETVNLYENILSGEIINFKEEKIKSTGFVVDTLQAVIWAILHSKTFSESVLKAINLGDDTDTIGALTGAISGIIYGNNSSLLYWFDEIQNKDYLLEVVNNFESILCREKILNIGKV